MADKPATRTYCKECRFWDVMHDRISTKAQEGRCRRHAPHPEAPLESSSVIFDRGTVWPATFDDDWCGEGQHFDNVDIFDDRSLLGRFTGEAPTVLGGSGNLDRNVMTTNLFVNSEFLYPQDVKNPARQFHNLKEAESMVPFVSRTLYSGQGDEAMSNANSTQYEGRGQSTDLAGKFFHQGFRTSGLSTRVDNRGVDLHMSASMEDRTFTQRAWLEVKRYVVISDGHLECYYV